MKKTIITLCTLLACAPAMARVPAPVIRPPYGTFDSAWAVGYAQGKKDQRIATEHAIIATGLIVIGTVIIYKALTAKDAPVNEYGRFSIKF